MHKQSLVNELLFMINTILFVHVMGQSALTWGFILLPPLSGLVRIIKLQIFSFHRQCEALLVDGKLQLLINV